MKKQIIGFLLFGFFVCAFGCAGGRGSVSANHCIAPVSLTGCVYDEYGRILETGRDLEVVEHFETGKTFWTMFYTAIPLNGKQCDLSEYLNEKLQENKGDAVTNLTVEAKSPFMLLGYISALAPVLPAYASVNIEGDIVRKRDKRRKE